jgi:hypothetical protein
MALLGCPRGHRVALETRIPLGMQGLTFRSILSLEPERLENPTGHRQRGLPGDGTDASPETLKLLVVSNVRRRNALLSSKRSK